LLGSIAGRFGRRHEAAVALGTQHHGVTDASDQAAEPARYRPFPNEHARELLQWLQGPGGITGQITAAEVMAAYSDMCAERGWSEGNWNTVAREFRRLINDPIKRHATIEGKRHVIYAVPRPGCNVVPFAPAGAA
jgi:hypothetical protein